MNKNKRIGGKPGCIIRSILTVSRKLKIAQFKQNGKKNPDRCGSPGSTKWNAKLMQYMKDPALKIDDIERWVRTHSWITAEDQPRRPTRPCRNFRRSRSLPRETTRTHTRVPTTPRSTSAFRRQRTSKRLTRQMASAASQYHRVVKNHNMEPAILEPMVTISPHRINFGNVVNADNYQRTSSPIPTSQRFFMEDAHEMTGMVMEGNDNGNPLEPQQIRHPQQWPLYDGLGRCLIASPAQQQFVYIPPNQIQMEGNGTGNSSQFILSDGNETNWPNSEDTNEGEPNNTTYLQSSSWQQESEQQMLPPMVSAPNVNKNAENVPRNQSIDLDNEELYSEEALAGLTEMAKHLAPLNKLCGQIQVVHTLLMPIEKMINTVLRAQRRCMTVMRSKGATAVRAARFQQMKKENVNFGISQRTSSQYSAVNELGQVDSFVVLDDDISG